jgi:hypothetical protein
MFNKTELDHLLWLVNERMQTIQQVNEKPSFNSANLEFSQLLDIEQTLHTALENISKESANI